MDLDALKLLLTVARDGSIAQAARATGVSRTTMRRRLGELEAEVGVPLVVFEPQGVRLTQAGRTLVDEGAGLLGQAQDLIYRLRYFSGQTPLTLRLVYPVGLPAVVRCGVLQFVWSELPGLTLVMHEAERPLAHLEEPFDLIVHFGPPPDLGQWYCRVVWGFPIGLVASPRYLERRGTPEHLDAALEHPLLIWRPALAALQAAGDRRVPSVGRVVSDDQLMLRTLASRGEGLLLGMAGVVPDDPGVGRLVDVLPGTFPVEVKLRALMPVPSRMEPGIAGLLDQIQGALERAFNAAFGRSGEQAPV